MKIYCLFLLIIGSQLVNAQQPDSLELKTFTAQQLYQDYDLLTSSLREAHTGLYWYNSKARFNKFSDNQRTKIRSGMNALQFYQILAPLIAYTKEGHTSLKLSKEIQDYMQTRANYFPGFIKIVSGRLYLINDLPGTSTKGCELLSINGTSAHSLLHLFMSFEPSDGYNQTGKYRWIEENAKFNLYYARCFPQVKTFEMSYRQPDAQVKSIKMSALTFEQLRVNYTSAIKAIPNSLFTWPATIQIDSGKHAAVLTINSFQKRRYAAAKMDFHNFVQQAFQKIRDANVTSLIIDIRKNGGGTEGYEDYLLSFMIKNDYVKYASVQASAFHYSFYPFTDYRNDWAALDSSLKAEHYLAEDGRILRKPGIEEHEKPQHDPYLGRIFVLTSGLTYSGGSEFASLMKNYTDAVFIGEETSGGYYGNTSGYRINLQLPDSGLEIAIPILKFVVTTPKKSNPVGRGVMPDIPLEPNIEQYLNGIDVEMNKAKQLAN